MIPIRKIKNTLGLMLLILLCGACEDWLSVSPKSQVKYDDLFSSENGFKDELTGIYTALCKAGMYGANLTFGAMDALGQQYDLGYWQRDNKYYRLRRFEYEDAGSKAVSDEIWGRMYNTVTNINILLKGLEEHAGVLSERDEKIYKGEALGLRAFLHFDLLRIFGPSWLSGAKEPAIPYVKVISKLVPPLSDVDGVLEQAINDLETAAELLENDPMKTGEATTSMLGTRVFRFNYYAVRALLSRVYLYRNDRTNALKNALEVIGAEKFPWVAREQVTAGTREKRDGIFVTECIFMLNNTLLTDLSNEYLRPDMWDASQANVCPMSKTVRDEIFEKDVYGTLDWRYTYYFEEIDGSCYSSKLWQFKYGPDGFKNRQPLLRISEMYLIAAECASVLADGVDYFNTFRSHRGFTGDMDLKKDISEGALRLEISKEYRKEFICEGQWFFYCKRLDREDIPDVELPFNKGYYRLPLPDIEIEYGKRN